MSSIKMFCCSVKVLDTFLHLITAVKETRVRVSNDLKSVRRNSAHYSLSISRNERLKDAEDLFLLPGEVVCGLI